MATILNMTAQIKYLTNHSTAEIRRVAAQAEGDYVFFVTDARPLEWCAGAQTRVLNVARDVAGEWVYSDRWDLVATTFGTVTQKHQLIDCQEGALRDDFDFGNVICLKVEALKRAVSQMDYDYAYAGLYDLRLRIGRATHIKEALYTLAERDLRASGEKQFDYVNPRNREVQIEMERACTEHLRRIGAWLGPEVEEVTAEEVFPVTASVVIPVYNRVNTIIDAVQSALAQRCDFAFNVIVVDNHSTDGTGEALAKLQAEDARLRVIVPERTDLGIGGCWNEAVFSSYAGEFCVQLDSDDLYSGPQTLARIVAEFRAQKCGMVIGAYQMTDFDLRPLTTASGPTITEKITLCVSTGSARRAPFTLRFCARSAASRM